MRRWVEAVQLEVLARQPQRGCVAIDADDLARAPERKREREATRVREAIQRAASSARIAAQRKPVLALVEKESRLLPRSDVDGERDAVLAYHDGIRRLLAPQDLAARRSRRPGIVLERGLVLLRRRERVLVPTIDGRQLHLAAQRVHDVRAVWSEPGAVELQDGNLSVQIGHHSGQLVTLSVHQADAVGHRRIAERHV